jgi:integrase
VQALQDWMAVASIKEGAIFRAVSKHGKISDNPLSPVDVNRIVKHYCKTAGLDAKKFSAHRLRSGFLMQEVMEQVVLTDFPSEVHKLCVVHEKSY